jgi:Zn-dependent M28 family amino/carboxypeptidase
MMDGPGMAKMFAARIPTAIVAGPGVKKVLEHLGVDAAKVLEEVAKETPGKFEKGSEPAGGLSLAVRTENVKAKNVVGYLRGSDPVLADEAVVFSAHMDHVGVRYDGDVFNGADDNASGTSGLLEIAHAFALAKERPRRSVVFLAVSGEEKGLWGSAYYADHPTWPLPQIVANVNTDMIGRSGPESGPDQVTVTPSFRHGMFSTIVRDAHRYAQAIGLGFENGDTYYARSDHYNFATKKIPVVFFCNGEHPDYHQVSDTADKLDPAKMEKIARLAFATGWAVADAAERPKVLGKCADWEGSKRRKAASEEPAEPEDEMGDEVAPEPPASRRRGR